MISVTTQLSCYSEKTAIDDTKINGSNSVPKNAIYKKKTLVVFDLQATVC